MTVEWPSHGGHKADWLIVRFTWSILYFICSCLLFYLDPSFIYLCVVCPLLLIIVGFKFIVLWRAFFYLLYKQGLLVLMFVELKPITTATCGILMAIAENIQHTSNINQDVWQSILWHVIIMFLMCVSCSLLCILYLCIFIIFFSQLTVLVFVHHFW